MKVKTYDELKQYAVAFNRGDIRFLIIAGRGGTGKTYTVKQETKNENTFFIKGHTSSMALFNSVRQRPRHNVIFDDTDALLSNKTNVALLKQICDTNDFRKVTWNTTLNGEHVEQSFISHNNVCLITNQSQQTSDKDLKALYNRAVTISFNPHHKELLRVAKKVCSYDVYDYVKNKTEISNLLTLRLFQKAENLKKAGLDWHKYVDENTPTKKALYRELHDAYSKKKAQQEYTEKLGISQSTYYRHKKKYG